MSGTTPNDFTSPVAYTVTAADNSTVTYTVAVTVASSSAKGLTAFSFTSPSATGTIDESAKTISVIVPNGTNVTAMVATFTTTGSSVKVGTTVQVSGTTPNNFTNPVVYIVTAADSSTATYTATVSVAAPAVAAAIELSKTGQTTCYDSTGTVIACTNTGQDGDLQKGVAWPSPRFTNADGTTPISGEVVVDQLTGLMWSRTTGTGPGACKPYQSMFWPNALDQVTCLNANSYLGYTDWRLPNVNELRSLINREEVNSNVWLNNQGFNLNYLAQYWSSTTYEVTTSSAWSVDMRYGVVDYYADKYDSRYVFPVRDAQAGAPIDVAKTGQTTCYDGLGAVISCTNTGQDGSYQKGVAWPSPRFTTNPDTSVTDNLTGLIWAPDANVMKTRDSTWNSDLWANDGLVKWQHALDYVAKLNTENFLGHDDWRLPNANELESLMHLGQVNPATWLNGQGFSNLATIYSTYWTSTTYSDSLARNEALFVGMNKGLLTHSDKAGNGGGVWPVRGGQ